MKVLFDSVSGRIRSIPPSVSKQSRVNPAPKELKSRGLSQGARKRRPTIHLYLSFDCFKFVKGGNNGIPQILRSSRLTRIRGRLLIAWERQENSPSNRLTATSRTPLWLLSG